MLCRWASIALFLLLPSLACSRGTRTTSCYSLSGLPLELATPGGTTLVLTTVGPHAIDLPSGMALLVANTPSSKLVGNWVLDRSDTLSANFSRTDTGYLIQLDLRTDSITGIWTAFTSNGRRQAGMRARLLGCPDIGY